MTAGSAAATGTTDDSLAKVKAALASGGLQAPKSPAANELIGVIEARRLGPDAIQSARESFSRALAARPTSPYTWARLAEVMYRMGETGAHFEAALVKAAQFGPHEAEVQQTVAFYGLAVWDEALPKVRAAVDASVRAGIRRKPLEMLQIAARRGRLSVACRHLAGSLRQSAPKSIQFCPSMEATP